MGRHRGPFGAVGIRVSEEVVDDLVAFPHDDGDGSIGLPSQTHFQGLSAFELKCLVSSNLEMIADVKNPPLTNN